MDIFGLSHFTVPVYLGTGRHGHWTLLDADMVKQQIRYYDSNGGDGRQYAEVLLRYLQEEWRRKKPGLLSSAWTCHGSDTTTVPQQGNTLDCAIYAMLIANALHHNIPVRADTLRIHGEYGRRHVGHCLSQGVLLPLEGAQDRGPIDLTVQEHTAPAPASRKIQRRSEPIAYDPPIQDSNGMPASRIGDYSSEECYTKLEIRPWGSAGLGLFTKERFVRNSLIGCCYIIYIWHISYKGITTIVLNVCLSVSRNIQ